MSRSLKIASDFSGPRHQNPLFLIFLLLLIIPHQPTNHPWQLVTHGTSNAHLLQMPLQMSRLLTGELVTWTGCMGIMVILTTCDSVVAVIILLGRVFQCYASLTQQEMTRTVSFMQMCDLHRPSFSLFPEGLVGPVQGLDDSTNPSPTLALGFAIYMS